ncbi:hypothetical protein TNCV_4118611 [Trichonephila clavipes]|nr:hypothetical protein TNCV_4118611 [Trichonephila clavipes]
MALYRSPLTVTLWSSSFLKKYGPMIPPSHNAHQTSKGHKRLDVRRKRLSLPDGCRVFAWKFFLQTYHQGHEQADELLSAYFNERLMPYSDNVQISLLCGGPGRPFWRQHHLFGVHSITRRPLSGHF